MTKSGNMNSVSKSMSRSTELLTTIDDSGGTNLEMNSTRHSWNTILDDKKPSDASRQSVSDLFETEKCRSFSPRRRTSSSANVLTQLAEQKFNRNSDRNNRYRLSSLGCLSPTSFLKDRPVTYEEELEEQVCRLRASAIQLHQKLANERKTSKDLAQQMAVQEENYKGLIEQIRSQYEQRFERLKGRAGLLVQRCEQLRREKKRSEEKMEQLKITATSEKQNLELQIISLLGEIETAKSKDECSEEINLVSAEENSPDIEVDSLQNQSDSDKTTDIWWNYYKILYDIALSKIVYFENLPNKKSQELARNNCIEDDCIPTENQMSVSRRSSSCPMLTVAGDIDLCTELKSEVSCPEGLHNSLSNENISSSSPRLNTILDSPISVRKKTKESFSSKSPRNLPDETRKISQLFINIVSPGGTQTEEDTRESSSSPGHIQDRSAKRHASLPRMEFLKKLTVRDKKESPKRKNTKTSGDRATQSMYETIPSGQDYLDSGCLRKEKHSSTESLTDETADQQGCSTPSSYHERLVRNGSAQSTFDRLRQRRNGVTDIVKIPPRVPNKASSSSMLDRIGSNIKQYLHHQ